MNKAKTFAGKTCSVLARLAKQARSTWLPIALVFSVTLPVSAKTCPAPAWPAWQTFSERFVQADGRVLESSLLANHSTSEGQSYALFFALVANDQARFEQIWRWSASNLSAGDPATNLPAWLWGQGKDGQWGVQDKNSASDADLWFVYALLEAARLWQRADYQADAERLLANIEANEVVSLPGLGAMLLPGPVSFVQPDHLWRLNPSYLPLPVLRRLDKQNATGPWREVASNTAIMLKQAAPKGYIADWVGYRGTATDRGIFVIDPFKGQTGSYDAIRVYLWAGMTAPTDPLAKSILASLDGMSQSTGSTGIPPETVKVVSGAVQGGGPFGFSAALIPYFRAKGQPWLADTQQRKAEQGLAAALATTTKLRPSQYYYDYALSLFGFGWAEQRYRFLADGRLQLSWENACSAIKP
jgi:endo-1,4-beta-D-glucanase Y